MSSFTPPHTNFRQRAQVGGGGGEVRYVCGKKDIITKNTIHIWVRITEVEGYRAGPDRHLAQHSGGGVVINTAMEAWKGGPDRLPRQSRQKLVSLESKELSLSLCVCASADGSWKGRRILGL